MFFKGSRYANVAEHEIADVQGRLIRYKRVRLIPDTRGQLGHRVAAGERLQFEIKGGKVRGHAIECRVNAEDPYRNFQPSPGTITTYHPPGGPGVRVDTHIYAGYTVPPYYDSLLAKVIVHGNTRQEALARMHQALDSFIIEGVTTTIPFLRRVIEHPDFAAGRVDTKFLERNPDLFKAE